jgi:hypothetical protein
VGVFAGGGQRDPHAAGLIGVEEACSGVRSLQATLMSAVVLGELFTCAGAIGRACCSQG